LLTVPVDPLNGNVLPGRNKPDVVAPGLAIFSAKTRQRPVKYPAVDHNDGSSNWDNFGDVPPTDADNWLFQHGTSMSTPLVAGCVAVVAKVLRNVNLPVGAPIPAPSPPASLIKALIINNTQDLTQGRGARPATAHNPAVGPAPDAAQGYGLVNVEAVLRNIIDTTYGGMLARGRQLVAGSRHTEAFIIRAKADPFMPLISLPITLTATLVWTDYPGAALVNVLSLRATNNGQTRWGNDTLLAGNRDEKNNVQKVVWQGINPGNTTLVVECHTLGPGTVARPNSGQRFSLVWYVSYGPSSQKAKAFATMATVATLAATVQYVKSGP
jgi:serine protease AprX